MVAGVTGRAKDVLGRQQARVAAQLAGDAAAFSALLHEDLLYIHTSGLEDDRASLVAMIAEGRIQYRHFVISDQRVRFQGDVALVDGACDIAIVIDGVAGQFRSRIVEAWVATADGWRLIHYQSTALPAV